MKPWVWLICYLSKEALSKVRRLEKSRQQNFIVQSKKQPKNSKTQVTTYSLPLGTGLDVYKMYMQLTSLKHILMEFEFNDLHYKLQPIILQNLNFRSLLSSPYLNSEGLVFSHYRFSLISKSICHLTVQWEVELRAIFELPTCSINVTILVVNIVITDSYT